MQLPKNTSYILGSWLAGYIDKCSIHSGGGYVNVWGSIHQEEVHSVVEQPIHKGANFLIVKID